MKYLPISILVAVIGAGVGFGGAWFYYQPRLEIARLETQEQVKKLNQAETLQDRLEEKIARLEKEYADQQDAIASLIDQQDELQAARAQAPASQTAPESPEPVGGLLDDWLSDLDEEDAEGDPEAEEETEESERREEWRANFRERMRENVNTFISDAMARADTPTEQDRLAAIAEYSDYLMELRQRMRDAETDEDRDLAREEMMTASRDLAALMREQQNEMVNDVVSQYGVDNPADQQRLVRELRQTLDSPFFGMERFISGMSRGRGGWSGGSDGGRRGGGFGGGGPR